MDPFLGEIRTFPWNFAPRGWASCSGQILPINQNQALFALLGTSYGGNGTSTFALPDLRGRVPLHFGSAGGQTYQIGQPNGSETVTLQLTSLPQHTHTMNATTSAANAPNALNGIPATVGQSGSNPTVSIYAAPSSGPAVALASNTIGMAGGTTPHNNMQPFLVLNPCIALQGIFPSRS